MVVVVAVVVAVVVVDVEVVVAHSIYKVSIYGGGGEIWPNNMIGLGKKLLKVDEKRGKICNW